MQGGRQYRSVLKQLKDNTVNLEFFLPNKIIIQEISKIKTFSTIGKLK